MFKHVFRACCPPHRLPGVPLNVTQHWPCVCLCWLPPPSSAALEWLQMATAQNRGEGNSVFGFVLGWVSWWHWGMGEHFTPCWQNKQELKAEGCIKKLWGKRKFHTNLLVFHGFGIRVHLPAYLEKVSPLPKVLLLVLWFLKLDLKKKKKGKRTKQVIYVLRCAMKFLMLLYLLESQGGLDMNLPLHKGEALL